MTRISKPMRSRRAAKRVDLTDLRAALADTRLYVSLGLVAEAADDADSEYYELVTDDAGQVTDILVEVTLVPSNIPVTCRLGGFSGAFGIIQIPQLGDEVMVNIPDGQVDWMPTIIARLSTGSVPAGAAPSPTKIVIMAETFEVHDGSGETDRLVRLSEFNELRQWDLEHTHAGLFGGVGSTALLTSPPTKSTAGTPPDLPPTATGTPVLRG